MNVLDSELVVGALRRAGYELTGDIAAADTLLFNTCSVREHAEHKIYSQLGRIKFLKRRRPQCVIGVMGCMAQKDQELIFQRAPHVDLVVGTGQLGEIPRLIEEVRAGRRSEVGGRRSEDGGQRSGDGGIRESFRPPTSDLRGCSRSASIARTAPGAKSPRASKATTRSANRRCGRRRFRRSCGS